VTPDASGDGLSGAHEWVLGRERRRGVFPAMTRRAHLRGLLLAAVLGSSSVARAQPGSTESLGAELGRLRRTPGHFGGGTWSDEIDAFGGRKHEVMEILASRLGVPGTPSARLLAIMGPPDERVRSGTELWADSVYGPAAAGLEALVYHWRGRHDFLYFLVRRRRVVRSGWWMAHE